jgi:hypothetical protein
VCATRKRRFLQGGKPRQRGFHFLVGFGRIWPDLTGGLNMTNDIDRSDAVKILSINTPAAGAVRVAAR